MLNKLEKFINKSLLIHGNNYDYSKVVYKSSEDKVEIFCKICNKYFLQIPYNHINKKQNCPNCCKNKKLSTEEFIEKCIKIHGDKYDYSKVIYINSRTNVIIGCKIHGDFEQLPNNHISKKCGCNGCNPSKKSSTKEFIEKSIKIHSNKYDYSKVIYINSSIEVEIHCNECKKWFFQKPIIHLQNHGCGCEKSKGEKTIEEWLIKNNIKFIAQHKFDGCRYKNPLFFDFYLIDYNLCIEHDGEQHFKPKFNMTAKEFEDIQIKDTIKNNYCSLNNIGLLRIRYDEKILEKIINFLE